MSISTKELAMNISATEIPMLRHLVGLSALPFSILIYFLMAPPAAVAVTVTGPAAIRLPASADSGVATLRIGGDSTESLILGAGELVDRSTKEVLPGTVAFEPEVLDVEPGRTYEIKVTASKILFEGEAEADVLIQGGKIGSLVVARAPFAVTLADAQAFFRPGEKTAITVRNDARYPYDVLWMVQIGVHKYCGAGKDCEATANWSPVKIPPKDGASIEIEPPGGWFDRISLFSEGTKEATLWLAFPGDLPKRALKLKANLQGRFYPGQTLWIFALLTMGALFSLIVRHWVPNTQRKRELKEQIRRIHLKIDGFSEDISSDLQVQTQVQCNLLDALRKSRWTFMPEYATVAVQCSQGIAVLERRVDLIEEIDSVCEQQRVKWDTCPPPSQIDRVEELLRSASEGLRKAQPSEAEFIAIKAQIDNAKALTDLMGTSDSAFGKELADRVQSMRKELRLFKGKKTYTDLSEKLPGLFETVEEAQPLDDAIPPLRYSLVDYNLSALEICRDYIWLFEGTKDTEILDKLENKVKPKLLQHLARQSWNELRLARLLLDQFREDSDVSQVWEAIKADNNQEMYIAYEPAEVRYQQLVQFRACFRREELNWSGARELVVPEWDFGDGSRERGCWMMSHFFTDPRNWWERMRDWVLRICGKELKWPKTIQVRFERTADATNRTTARTENALTREVLVTTAPFGDRRTRTISEFVGLLVSISVPLVSLVAGAKEQLAQNPVGGALMVSLLGFSSDALISVFKQRVSSSS